MRVNSEVVNSGSQLHQKGNTYLLIHKVQVQLRFPHQYQHHQLYWRDQSNKVSRKREKGRFEYAFGVPHFQYDAQEPGLRNDFDLAMSARRDCLLPQWFHVHLLMEMPKTDAAARREGVIVDVAGKRATSSSVLRPNPPNATGGPTNDNCADERGRKIQD